MPEIVTYACLGLKFLGECNYNPAAPASLYFSLGEVVGALAFTLAVQQLLRPIHRFRLAARYLSLRYLYILVFGGVGAAIIAAIVPNIPVLHGGPWGYGVVWELVAAFLFIIPYAAVVLALVHPVKVKPGRIEKFARSGATLLSEANETDHVDFLADLNRSLSLLIEKAKWIEDLGETTAFFDFAYRKKIADAGFAYTFLRIISDGHFCETLVKRAPWRVADMLRDISAKHLHARSAEAFIQELAHVAILRDDSMIARETEYHGFGTAPLLSEALFSDWNIVVRFNPLDRFSFTNSQNGAPFLKRFNTAAKRCIETLIREKHVHHAHVAWSIQSFYRSVFMRARQIQTKGDEDVSLSLEMHYAVENAAKLANSLLASFDDSAYASMFIVKEDEHRHDVLEALVSIVYDSLTSIANKFEGFDDPFWMLAMEAVHDSFHATGAQPEGMTPYQQRLALKLIRKLNDNMRGFYPAISRVLLATVGPYQHDAEEENATAFRILKEAMYGSLKELPELARTQPGKIADYLPSGISYDPASQTLTKIFRDGATKATNLAEIEPYEVDLKDPQIRRSLTEDERRRAEALH
jgi:hypothetical protein